MISICIDCNAAVLGGGLDWVWIGSGVLRIRKMKEEK